MTRVKEKGRKGVGTQEDERGEREKGSLARGERTKEREIRKRGRVKGMRLHQYPWVEIKYICCYVSRSAG